MKQCIEDVIARFKLERRERVAKALYEEVMKDAAILPWPCSNAETYRRFADAAIKAYEEDA